MQLDGEAESSISCPLDDPSDVGMQRLADRSREKGDGRPEQLVTVIRATDIAAGVGKRDQVLESDRRGPSGRPHLVEQGDHAAQLFDVVQRRISTRDAVAAAWACWVAP